MRKEEKTRHILNGYFPHSIRKLCKGKHNFLEVVSIIASIIFAVGVTFLFVIVLFKFFEWIGLM